MDKTIYLCLAHMSEEGIEQKYVKKPSIRTGWFLSVPNVNAFEEDLKRFVGEGKGSGGTFGRYGGSTFGSVGLRSGTG